MDWMPSRSLGFCWHCWELCAGSSSHPISAQGSFAHTGADSHASRDPSSFPEGAGSSVMVPHGLAGGSLPYVCIPPALGDVAQVLQKPALAEAGQT